MSETSLENTSGLEFEFVIVNSVRDSNLEGFHMVTKIIIQMMIPVKKTANDEFLARV